MEAAGNHVGPSRGRTCCPLRSALRPAHPCKCVLRNIAWVPGHATVVVLSTWETIISVHGFELILSNIHSRLKSLGYLAKRETMNKSVKKKIVFSLIKPLLLLGHSCPFSKVAFCRDHSTDVAHDTVLMGISPTLQHTDM